MAFLKRVGVLRRPLGVQFIVVLRGFRRVSGGAAMPRIFNGERIALPTMQKFQSRSTHSLAEDLFFSPPQLAIDEASRITMKYNL